jgi:alpha-L-rhamnosidase/Glycosyl hydrolases family 2, sugar binding domain
MKFLSFLWLICFLGPLHAQNLSETEFKNPSNQYRPRTWMHAMSANMSKEGLTKDLESMKAVGIGGLLLFNITQGIPNGRIVYNSTEHHAMITHAAKEAERLGLSFGVHNCDGWSSSGGPWVTPDMSMKMLVFTEQVVKGGGKTTIQLAKPTVRAGLYRDVAVLAYPSLPSEISDVDNAPTVTASDKNFETAVVNDQNLELESSLKPAPKEKAWIQFEYGKPHTVRSFFALHNSRNAVFELAISDDGINFSEPAVLKKVRTGKGEWGQSLHFTPKTARFFRIYANETAKIKELKLSATLAPNNLLGRIGMDRAELNDLDPIGTPTPDMVIDKNNIADLTNQFNTQHSTLETDLPAGNWTILRFGYTSTSAFNHPASSEGRGLEVDKFSRTAFKIHYDAFVKKVIDNSKKVAPNALQYIEIDSYEMGGQTWTDGLDHLFKAAKGYDLRAFLPLFAGRFVESADASEAVLADFRDLTCQLMTDNYFGYFQELCHLDGLKTYIEPYGFGPVNDLEVGGKADMPMGEFWMNRNLTQVQSAISAGHIYGKNVISAESFTTEPSFNWKGHPALAKISGDKAWAAGINEFMFHRFAHQANSNVEPGMTMNRWGFHFDRTQTWWYNAGAAWFSYIARGSYLLRQGVPVADLLVFVGDVAPNSGVKENEFKPRLPDGLRFDVVNAEVLHKRILVKNGQMVLPEGTTYKVLVLKNSEKIKLQTLKRLHELAEQGVAIVGDKPVGLLGYNISASDKKAFEQLTAAIWSKPNVQAGFDWPTIVEKHQIEADFAIEGRNDINFMHRKMPDSDLYFFYNPDSVARIFKVKFRVTGKMPALWNAMDGSVTKLSTFTQNGSYSEGTILLNAEASAFVVFSKNDGSLAAVKGNALEQVNSLPISGNWTVQFNEKQGYGGTVALPNLMDWKDHPLDSIRYFSGTAMYKKTFSLPKNHVRANHRLLLDLGKVNIVATVKLNGKNLGVSWMPPFELDITEAAKAGENQLEIEVTNQWSNRLIGEERFPATDGYQYGNDPFSVNHADFKMPEWYVNNEPQPKGQRTTFTTADFYKATDELMPSGLLGPVQVKVLKVVRPR